MFDRTLMVMEESLNKPLSEVLQVMQHRLMHESTYFGVKALKSPTDFWVYQELMYTMRPEFVIEIGNAFGGSTLALAHLCDLLGKGQVIGIDISHASIAPCVREHPRITLLEGDAVKLFDTVSRLVGKQRVLIIEDSSHTYDNTLAVLRQYADLVHPGDYLIVEDSICHHGLDVGPSPGPYEAIEQFVGERPEFMIDRSKESFLITWNPKGFLKRL